VLGLAFKEGSDDLRESPAVELVARLLSEGYRVVVYDANVFPSTLVGSNREYSERRLPTLPSLMRPTLAAALTEAEVVVITRHDPEFARVFEQLQPQQIVIDLAGARTERTAVDARYQGICW